MPLLILLFLGFSSVKGNWYSSPTKLKVSDSNKAEANQQFGSSIAIGDTYVVVGAPFETVDNKTKVGTITIFTNDNNTRWEEKIKLASPLIEKDLRFGCEIAVYNKTIIVGSQASRAYIFQNNGSTWSLKETLDGALCGYSVAIHGNYAVVGCSLFKRVTVFNLNGSWIYQATLVSNNITTNLFGDSVTIYGNYIAVAGSSAVYIFKLNENVNQWIPHMNIKIPIAFNGAANGRKISMYGDRLALVSTISNLNISSVYVYKINGATWYREGYINLTSSNLQVSLHHETLIIGSQGLGDINANQGRAYVYTLINNTWQLYKEIFTSDVEVGDDFGRSVACWTNIIVVGAPYDDDEGINSGAIYLYQISSNYSIVCEEDYFKAIWLKSTIHGDEVHVYLRNKSCNTYSSNTTHIWISSPFTECGTSLTETDTSIIVSNEATLTLTKYLRNRMTKRESNYLYNIQCVTDRSVDISSPGSYKLSDISKTIIGKASLNYKISMDFYEDETFGNIAANPLTVNSNQFIYVGMKSNNTYFKFIVHKCFATPSSIVTDQNSDVFFNNKCSRDETFDIVYNDDVAFNFKIQSFSFVDNQIKSAYMHCNVFVCKTSSTSSACTQNCAKNRKRRAINGNNDAPLKEVFITSKKIIFKETLMCVDMTCPPNSKCFDFYPATCICNDRYVFSRKSNTCTDERIVEIKGMHLDIDWNPTYANTMSTDFLKLAVDKAALLYKLFNATETDRVIEGVKVVGARQGSVILDVKIIYAKSTTKEFAFESFLKSITTNTSTTNSVQKGLNIIHDRVPSYIYLVSNDTNKMEVLLIIILTVSLLVLLIAGITCYKIKQLRRVSVKENKKESSLN